MRRNKDFDQFDFRKSSVESARAVSRDQTLALSLPIGANLLLRAVAQIAVVKIS